MTEIKKFKRRVNYYETDQMGIVHHSNYIRYFEEARIEYLNQIGCDIRILEKDGIIIPNVDAYARYHKPLRYYDEFTVDVFLVKFNGSRIEFDYEVRLADTNELAATGHTTHCCSNKNLRPLSVKHSHPEFYSKMKETVTADR